MQEIKNHETLILTKTKQKILTCFRCDGKGKYMNEFGIMEKCESCQRPDMTFEKAEVQDSEE